MKIQPRIANPSEHQIAFRIPILEPESYFRALKAGLKGVFLVIIQEKAQTRRKRGRGFRHLRFFSSRYRFLSEFQAILELQFSKEVSYGPRVLP
jgi:hypothetical protein